jgi:hypothetical protein
VTYLFDPDKNFFGLDGRLLANGKVYFCVPDGTANINTLKTIYTTEQRTVTASNPQTLTATGRFAQEVHGVGKYDVVIKVSVGGATVRTLYNVTGGGSAYTYAGIEEYGASPDNPAATNVTAINAAIAAFNAGTIDGLTMGPGFFSVNSVLTTITRDGFSLIGAGKRTSGLYQTASASTLVFSNATPNTNRINDITLEGFCIDYGGVSNPTGGIALQLVRPGRSYFDIDIRSTYSGILITGGADCHFSSSTITTAFTWGSVASGSYLVRFVYHSGATEMPSEMYFSGMNWKGYTASFGGNLYLSNGIIIESGDGLHFDNGHVGFSHGASVYFNAQNIAGASIQNIEFNNIYFDGAGGGNTGDSMILLGGSTTPVVEGIHFDGCVVKNYDGNGVNFGLSTARGLRISDCQIQDIGAIGITITDSDEVMLTGNTIKDTNGNNSGATAVALVGCAKAMVSNNQILAGASTNPVGLSINAACSDVLVVENQFEGHTADLTNASTDRIRWSGNQKVGSYPTCVAASPLVIPLGYDVVEVTGNTSFSAITATVAKGQTLQLMRSEERRVGKECRSRWSPYH